MAFLAKHMDYRLETADVNYNMLCNDRATTFASDVIVCMFRNETINDRN